MDKPQSICSTLPAARALSLTLDAEVMPDADTGALSLVASTDAQLADFAEVTPAGLRNLVADVRARLAEFERLADEQEAREQLAALLAEHSVELEEWNPEKLDPKLREDFHAFDMVDEDGSRLLVFPAGQDPIFRLAVARARLTGLGGAA